MFQNWHLEETKHGGIEKTYNEPNEENKATYRLAKLVCPGR